MKIIETTRQKIWRNCDRILRNMKHEPATVGEFIAAYQLGMDGALVAYKILCDRLDNAEAAHESFRARLTGQA